MRPSARTPRYRTIPAHQAAVRGSLRSFLCRLLRGGLRFRLLPLGLLDRFLSLPFSLLHGRESRRFLVGRLDVSVHEHDLRLQGRWRRIRGGTCQVRVALGQLKSLPERCLSLVWILGWCRGSRREQILDRGTEGGNRLIVNASDLCFDRFHGSGSLEVVRCAGAVLVWNALLGADQHG